MLYIYLDTHQIKLLHLKKSLLGAYEAAFYKKIFDTDLLENGLPKNIDVINSAVKKTLELIPETPLKDRDVTLIMPQPLFLFFRADMPVDIASSVVDSYVKEKLQTELKLNAEDCYYSYFVQESEGQKKIIFYGIQKETYQSILQPFTLLELKLHSIIPESLAYYKLFEKTLRINKKETIWYINYDDSSVHGYVYDSFGLLEPDRFSYSSAEGEKIEKVLQKKASEYASKNIKLNRLILSGEKAEKVRQDTFTKDVGVWTNPLFRIIPHFYNDYLKLLQHEKAPVPILEHDVMLGAFIFSLENKQFSLVQTKKTTTALVQSATAITTKKMPWKGIILFAISFIITFIGLYFLSKTNINWNIKGLKLPALSMPSLFSKNTPTPVPSPTPEAPTPTTAPAIDRTTVRIKVLNGSGIPGKASDVKEFLNTKGYEEILTGNADAFDYETTVVQIKKENNSELQKLISQDIASQVPKPTFEALDEDEASDIVIVVGTDFK